MPQPPRSDPAGPDAGDGPDTGGGPDELEVTITPDPDVLDALTVTEDEFEWALGRALDRLEETPDDEEPCALEEVEILLNGRTFRLEEVARVTFAGDLSELGPLPDEEAP